MIFCRCGKGHIRVGTIRNCMSEREIVLLCDATGHDFQWCRYNEMQSVPGRNLASDCAAERKRILTRDLKYASPEDVQRYLM